MLGVGRRTSTAYPGEVKDTHFLGREPIDALYRWFADETAPTSPVWERLCRWVADTPAVHARLDALPGMARQPNRFLAAVRYLGGPTEPGPAFLAWLEEAWPQVEEVVLTRTTQTNEPGRCAVTAPVLASLPQPVALLELGPSAGLCLLPDRYAYRYPSEGDEGDGGDEGGVGPVVRPGSADPASPVLTCTVTGTPPGDPTDLVVAGRLGLDLNPLDVTDPDTRRWLRALVWPGEEDREERLVAALEVAAQDPPPLRRTDLTQDPAAVVGAAVEKLRTAYPGATPVVLHSAVLAYLDAEDRAAVCDAIRASGARWLSMEGLAVVPGVRERAEALGGPPSRTTFVLALDGEPVGWAQAHGRWVTWV